MYRYLFPLMGGFAAHAASAACVPPTDQQNISIVACGASTPSSDKRTAIDSALAAAATFGTGIFVPPGIFMTSGHPVPAAGAGIYGIGTLKLTAASTNPIIDTNSSGNIISGQSFDLSAGTVASRTAIDIDGGSSGTIVSSVTTRFGRIQSLVTNGRSAPIQITIKNNVVSSAKVGGTGGGAINIDTGTTQLFPAASAPTTATAPRSSLEYSRRAAATSTPTLETIPRTTWGAA